MDTEALLSRDPFFLEGGEPGALLIHGYLTSPQEMRPLGAYLHGAGMTVHGIRLRGHGTRPEDLEGVTWRDWVEDVRAGLARLRATCRRVSLVGLSLGGALALHVAAEEEVERVVAFSAPDDELAHRLPLVLVEPLSNLLEYVPKIGSDMRDLKARAAHFTYDRIPLHSAREIAELLQALEEDLPCIEAPTLLVQARHDHVVPLGASRRIAAALNGPHKVVTLENGGHTVVLDLDREEAWEAARAWLTGEFGQKPEA